MFRGDSAHARLMSKQWQIKRQSSSLEGIEWITASVHVYARLISYFEVGAPTYLLPVAKIH